MANVGINIGIGIAINLYAAAEFGGYVWPLDWDHWTVPWDNIQGTWEDQYPH